MLTIWYQGKVLDKLNFDQMMAIHENSADHQVCSSHSEGRECLCELLLTVADIIHSNYKLLQGEKLEGCQQVSILSNW